MEKIKLEKFKYLLQKHRDNISNWISRRLPETEIIMCCDLNNESNTEKIKDQLVTHKIEQALEKIDSGQFGKCTMCDGEVEEERLALDFTTCVCLDHYSESQIRELEKDLALAAKVQKQLFPQDVPSIPGIQLAVRSEPSKIVGGDYFDFFSIGENMQATTIADVMGKGLPASMLMSNLQASLRIIGPENNKLEKTVFRLNELFRYNLKTIKFITLVIAAIDIEHNRLLYCNAGHNPPLWLKQKTNSFELLNPTGPAIGLFSEPEYKSAQVEFRSGDVLLFYTDGLTEAKSDEDEFGEKRLEKFLLENREKTAQQILTQLFDTVKKHSTSDNDDMTALLIKIE
jgi:sigma-B regulation protein RsbU (phosphoserine phosphatase)